ncbi:cupin domain-containing protein [Nocardia nova]|uniref:cupin domain-containing protein n=1 Tax=Nocardia nova TaxID=37330 RepID=UPI0037104C15
MQGARLRADEAEILHDIGLSLITLLADGGQTGGALTADKAILRKGSPGAPAHFHTAATEMFLVLNGSVRILLGNRNIRRDPGDFLTVPPTDPHALAPAAGADADRLVVFTPRSHRFDYYRLLPTARTGPPRRSQRRRDPGQLATPRQPLNLQPGLAK